MNQRPLLTLVRALVVLIAVLVLLIAYYWTHKPIDVGFALRIGGAALDLLIVGFLLLMAAVWGRAALSRLAWRDSSPLERLPIEIVIGLGMISLIVLLFGLIGFLYPALIAAALVISLVFLRVTLAQVNRAIREIMRLIRPRTPFETGITLFAGVLLLFALLIALAPAAAWDSLTYHLVAPQRMLAEYTITAHGDNFFLGFPQIVETLYALVIGMFGRSTAAAPLHFAFGVLALMLTASITRRILDRRAAYVAVAILLSSYSLWRLFGAAYVDLGVMAVAAAAFVIFFRWRRDAQPGWLILIGVLLGFGVGIKYIMGVYAVALLIAVLAHSPPRLWLANMLRLTIPALIVFAPWMIKGALLYQNPIYPYFFGGLNWDAQRMAAFNIVGGGLLNGRVWHLPILPVAAAIFGVHNGEGYAFSSGVWLLTAPFLLLIVWWRLAAEERRLLRDGVLLLTIIVIAWGVLSLENGIAAQTRMIVMAFPLFALLGAAAFTGIDRLPEKPINVGFVVRAVFAITLIFSAADVLRSTVESRVIEYTAGLIDERDYLYQALGAHHPALADLGAVVPEGGQVRLMWEPRSFYCPSSIQCVPDVMFDHWRRGLVDSPEAVFEAYRAAGDDYLLFWESGFALDSADPAHAEANAQFAAARDQVMTPVWTDGFYYTLYTWR